MPRAQLHPVRRHELGQHQFDRVAEAAFHADQAGWQVGDNFQQLAAHLGLDKKRLAALVSANALVRLDRYISWTNILKLTENDPGAAYAAERLHTVLQYMGK